MIVMKFGGTSVGNAQRMKEVIDIVKSKLNERPVVVVSAVSGITDKLIAAANKAMHGTVDINEIRDIHYKILDELKLPHKLVDSNIAELNEVLDRVAKVKELTTKTLDTIVSFGERMSSKIVAAYMKNTGTDAEAHDAYDVGMFTTEEFGSAEPLPEAQKELKKHLKDKKAVPIITGFIGKTKLGEITTLGRGGSDYSAAIIGAALDVKEIQIWTDVPGVMTTDPRVVKEAKSIDALSFTEAAELAYFGAKVLHPKTIVPAINKNIPVRVLNTYDPKHPGTLILKKVGKSDKMVKAIAFKKNISLFRIISTRMLMAYGFMEKVFKIFAENKVPIDMVSTSEVSVSLTIDKADKVEQLKAELSKIADVEVETGRAIICAVGEGMRHVPGIAGKIFTTCGENGINIEMISQGASEVNISFIVKNEDCEKAVKALHAKFC